MIYSFKLTKKKTQKTDRRYMLIRRKTVNNQSIKNKTRGR